MGDIAFGEPGFEPGCTTILANSNERPDREHRYGTITRRLGKPVSPSWWYRDAALPNADLISPALTTMRQPLRCRPRSSSATRRRC